ncbi:MAG: hypothetical protein B7Z70_13855 [Acidithiobacillus ferrivorans]|uniref:Helix-hairpin-helix DNA-binding motif class 1 domain-containing protein n=1 Tax=Acidithiobacillus ferrivorans TaxID=160808 RepID=A0A257SLD3_9PROT|nr:MAG: hypothetical protein B7Z70_13855 [Acidithiobacillus ferrivorans]
MGRSWVGIGAALLLLGLYPGMAQAAPPPPAMVNINTADAQQLQDLPGIGARRAEAIVAFRAAHGPFPGKAALAAVPGVGPKLAARLRGLIVLGPLLPGPTARITSE